MKRLELSVMTTAHLFLFCPIQRRNIEYYDEVELCTEAAEHHFKSAHQIRNRFMVDRSDLVVFAWNTTQAVLIKQCSMQRKQMPISLICPM